MPFAPNAGGSGRSTPPQLEPPSKEKYPRIGSRKISFEPPAMFFGVFVLMAMNVSLCGPHSLETSTLVPKAPAAEGAVDRTALGPLLRMNWYLSHQVGFFESLTASAGHEMSAIASAIFFIGVPSGLESGRDTSYTSGRPFASGAVCRLTPDEEFRG